MDKKYVVSGYIKSSELGRVVSPDSEAALPGVDTMADGFTASFDANSSTLNITWPAYPDAKALEVVSDKMDIGTYNGVMRTGTKRFDYSWISGPIEYKADIMVDGTLVNTISSSKENTTASLTIRPGSSVQVCGYYAYQNSTVNPAKSNTSCVTITAEDASLTLTVPNKNQSFETISAWLDQYGLMYEPTTEAPNSNYENGTYEIRMNGKDVTGKIFTLTQSELARSNWIIVEHRDQE